MGDRWQVRWRTPDGTPGPRQPRRNFALRDPGPGEPGDPELHASAFDKVISASIVTRTYVDPKSAEVTLRDYAEQWRAGRKMDVNAAADVERRFRLHVYEGKPGSGRTQQGGVSIGQHSMGLLAARPSLTAAWITAMPLAASSALHVVCDVSAVYAAAMDDGIIGRDPTKSPSVERPSPGRTLARAWSVAQVDAQAAQLPPRWRIVPELGAGTGMRRGEMLGLDVDDIGWLEKEPRVQVARSLKVIGGELRFGPLKNRKPHSVPLESSLKDRLARHLLEFPAKEAVLPWHDPADKERHGLPCTVRLVITPEGPGPVDLSAFAFQWRQARKKAGVTPEGRRGRDDGCHALRHTFASSQLRAGVDIVRVASWLGDTVEMVASTYAHLMPGDDDADGRAAVAAFFAGREPCAPDVPSEAAK
jgi:integrase